MAISQQTKNYLQKARQEGPEYYRYMPDDVLYWELDKKGEAIPTGAIWQEEAYQMPQQTQKKTEDLGFFANLADWWIDDNSYDFMKAAYNRSLTGTAEKLLTGESRYDVDESDFSILQDIGASVVSFLMPLDILTMGAGGFVGGKVANAALKKGLFQGAQQKAAMEVAIRSSKRKIAKKVVGDSKEIGLRGKPVGELIKKAQNSYMPLGDKAVMDVLSKGHRALYGGIQQAPVLALYEAAITGMNYEIEGKNFMEGAAWGAFHGGMLGAATGAIGGGMGAIQASMFNKAGGKKFDDLGLKDYLVSRGVVGLPGQVVAEGSLFSGVELAERVHAGEDIQGKEILHTFARNVGLFGALKTQGILTKKGMEKWNETLGKAKKDYYDWKEKKTNEVLKDTQESLRDTGIESGELAKEVGKSEESKVRNEPKAEHDIFEDFYKNREKMFDKDGNLKSDKEIAEIAEREGLPSSQALAESVYNLNNGLKERIQTLKELEKNTKDPELQKEINENIVEMEKVENKIKEKFGEFRDQIKTQEKTVGGATREQAIETWSDADIRTKVDEYGVGGVKEVDGKITNREKVIDFIFASDRAKKKHERDVASGEKGIDYEIIDADKRVEKFLDKTDESGFNLGETRKKTEENRANIINKANLSSENSKIIGDAIVNQHRKDIGPSSLTEIVDLFKFIQDKKRVENVKNLTKEEFEIHVRDYLNNKLGFEIVSKTTGKLIKPSSVDKHFGGNKEASHKAQSKYEKIYQSLADVFGAHEKHGGNNRLSDVLGFNPLLKAGTRHVKARKTITIPGGRDSIVGEGGMSKILEKSDKVYEIDGKKVSSYEAHVIVEVMDGARMRPGETPFGIKITKKLLGTGELTLSSPGKEYREITLSTETVAKIKELMKRKGLKTGDKLFEFGSAKGTTQGNRLFREIYKDIPENIQPQVYDRATAKYVPFKERVKLPDGESATKGVQPMSLMRREFAGEGEGKRKQADLRGHEKHLEDYEAPAPPVTPEAPKIKVYYKPKGSGVSGGQRVEKRIPKAGEKAARYERSDDGKVKLKKFKEISKVEQKDGETLIYFKGEKNGVPSKNIVLLDRGKAGPPRLKEAPKTKRKTQVDTGKVKEKMEIGLEEQQSMKELILEGSSRRKKAYGDLEIILNQKLKKKGGEKVLGQIEGHTIKIAEGKVKPDTIPHEVSHYVVDVLRAFGSKIDKSLIKRGEKMFGSEEALVQRVGELATNQLTNKSLISKAKSWVKAFNARLKDIFGMAGKEDVAYLLSRRVVKGNIPTGRKIANHISRMETHYQKDTPQKPPNLKRARNLDKKLESSVGREILDIGRELNDISKKGKGKEKDWTDGAVNGWVDWLEGTNKAYENSKASKGKTTFLDELVTYYQLTKEDARSITQSLKHTRYDANHNNLTPSGKAEFALAVMSEGSATKQITSSQTHAQVLSGFKIPFGLQRAVLPTYYVLQKYGGNAGKAIAESLLKFDVVANNIYKGYGDVSISNIKSLLTKKQNSLVWMFDSERVEKMIKDSGNKNKKAIKGLTQEELNFYGRLKDVNGKEIKHNTKDELITTKEGRAKKIHAQLMNFYWKGLKKEVKNVTNRAEYRQFEKEFHEKFVEGYFSRRITKEALEYFVSGKNGKNLEGLIDKNIKQAAKKKAEKSGKKGIALAKERERLIEDIDFRNSVAEDVLNMITHKHHKVKNKHLLERGPLIDEFITITDMKTGKDKTIRVYETDISSTIEPYVMTMSKYLATVRFFPEYTGLGGKYKLSESGINKVETMMQSKDLGAYALKAIQRTIGFKGEDPLLAEMHSGLAKLSHFSAASGLSSPTSGLKNMMIGIPRAIASFGFINTGKGIIKLFDKSVWNEAREKGILEYGAKHLELGQAKLGWFSMEKLFRWNFMTQSENFNRIISHEAGKLFFQNQLNILHGNKGLFGESNLRNAKRLMKDVWKFSDDDIAFLMSKEVKDLSFKSSKNEGRYEYLIRQAGHFSHVSAQGGTSVALLPLWASGRTGRPLTLFQRMAYSTTWDSYINYYKPAVTHKNFAPLGRALAMHSLSGAALYGFYKALFDKEPPESAGTALDKMTMYLYRSEFLGLGGFLFSPYDEGMFQSLAQPVIARNAREGLRHLNHFISGRDNLPNAINNWVLKTNVAYNQFDQLVYKNTDEYRLMKKVRNWRNQFAGDYPSFKKPNVDIYSERTYYYRDLKNALYFGSDKEIINNYFAAYNFIVTELEEINSSPKWRHKKAVAALKNSLSSMNPLKISDESTGKNMSKKKMFLNWIKENLSNKEYQEALKSEKNYQHSMRRLKKLIGNRTIWKQKSVYSSLNL